MACGPVGLELGTSPGQNALPARQAFALAFWLGLLAGALDLLSMVVAKRLIYHHPFIMLGEPFPWSIPLMNLAVVMLAAALGLLAGRLFPRVVTSRAIVWLLVTLALWAPLLRMPLYEVASFFVAAGLARPLSWVILRYAPGFLNRTGRIRAALLILLAAVAVLASGRAVLSEPLSAARLPAAKTGAPNVLLVVLDSVPASHLSLYGYHRKTTPNLERWAQRGVRFDRAIAPASWTFASHASFFTGHWPFELVSYTPGWPGTLAEHHTTLAEHLKSHGYLTGGFVANTLWCSYESGLNQGFLHFDDYPLTPQLVASSTPIGAWAVRHLEGVKNYWSLKWLSMRSRDSSAINQAFLGWLDHYRQARRPFFAFLNYMDAHDPYIPPSNSPVQFGLRPHTDAGFRRLMDYATLDKRQVSQADVAIPRDCFDDCIAHLDQQLGSLLDQLERRGDLQNTIVIVTADHGEEFGEHQLFGHNASLYLNEVHVPLLIIAPGQAPAHQSVAAPVSLRDLPATLVDLLQLESASPFPGQSLAQLWRNADRSLGGAGPEVLADHFNPNLMSPAKGRGPSQQGFAMSVVSGPRQYILDSVGHEELYDVQRDPQELENQAQSPDQLASLARFKSLLLSALETATRSGGIADEYYVKAYRSNLRAQLASLRAQARTGPASAPARPIR